MYRHLLDFCLMLCLSLTLFFALPANARTTEPYNYYAPAPIPLLEKVEEYHLPQAVKELERENYEFAWGEFSFVLHYFPNHPKALEKMGALSIMMGSPERAKPLFEAAIEQFPEVEATRTLYGEFLLSANYLEDASKTFEALLAKHSASPDLHYHLGMTYFAQGNFSEAKDQALLAYEGGYAVNTLKDQLVAVGAW